MKFALCCIWTSWLFFLWWRKERLYTLFPEEQSAGYRFTVWTTGRFWWESESTCLHGVSVWQGRTAPKWRILCQVGRKTLTQSIDQVGCVYWQRDELWRWVDHEQCFSEDPTLPQDTRDLARSDLHVYSLSMSYPLGWFGNVLLSSIYCVWRLLE